MKALIFTLCVFNLAACAHTLTQGKDITFSQASKLKPGITSKQEIEALFGSDVKKVIQGDDEIWTYNEPVHQYQRLTLSLNKKNIVQWVIWLPHSKDEALSLDYVTKQITGLTVDPKSDPYENPHDADGRLVYRNEKSGIVITFHTGRNEIERIVWYDPNVRAPAGDKPKRRFIL